MSVGTSANLLTPSGAFVDTAAWGHLAGVKNLTVGRADSTADIKVGAITLANNLTLVTGAAQTIEFDNAVQGGAGPDGHALSVVGGNVNFTKEVGGGSALSQLDASAITGKIILKRQTSSTKNSQSYGAVELDADATLTSTQGGLTFSGVVNGDKLLTIVAPGTTTFAKDVAVNTLTIANGNHQPRRKT